MYKKLTIKGRYESVSREKFRKKELKKGLGINLIRNIVTSYHHLIAQTTVSLWQERHRTERYNPFNTNFKA